MLIRIIEGLTIRGGKLGEGSSNSDNPRFQGLTPFITFRKFSYNESVARDEANLDIIWLKDESFEDTENLPPPAKLAAESAGRLGGFLRGGGGSS